MSRTGRGCLGGAELRHGKSRTFRHMGKPRANATLPDTQVSSNEGQRCVTMVDDVA